MEEYREREGSGERCKVILIECGRAQISVVGWYSSMRVLERQDGCVEWAGQRVVTACKGEGVSVSVGVGVGV